MKKILQLIGALTLICFSFFYTEKVSLVIKNIDELMIKIKEESEKNYLLPIDAIVNENTIIPGLYGLKININQSYRNMKRLNQYNEKLLIYEEVKPQISIEDTYDKYIISGNKEKKQISIILIINNKTNIDYIRSISKAKNIKFNIFIDGTWIEDNNELLELLNKEGHNIGNLSYNNDYKNSYYIWIDTILKKIIKQKNNYCYMEKENKDYLSICASNKNYTISPSIIINKNTLSIVKEKITNGSIISIYTNDTTLDELKVTINYILSKGYKIVTLDDLIDEK